VITLTRPDGGRFGLNDEQIERIDGDSTTVVTLVNGNRYIVCETVDEIVELVVEFRARAQARGRRYELRPVPEHPAHPAPEHPPAPAALAVLPGVDDGER
jgi:flagellar protein FlbD